ncbi:carbon-nitrogen hydrolase family protein [Novosphingobium profundi]|uniref:carbon-nitrogen hydrolase family protein n=1 Tax=Novosphingobium profundi TaxID=1774954 RepID=UPI001BD9B50B|nr:carbon-nitrogen hydrolase family protein [Novosphingobium profundi]MBT0670956.1 carbon-nitrogen hydrolase family protein [Novosphingobium profundi]
MLRAAVIQLNTQNDKQANLAAIEAQIRACVARERPDWIQLPEHAEWLGGSSGAPAVAEPFKDGPTYALLSRLAAELKVWIHGGSFYEQSDNPGRAYNTTVVFDRDGVEQARYRKIHLFDVTTADGAKFHESATVDPGRQIVTYDCEGVKVGCAICYDVRFPELFQELMRQGAQLIALPAAFTLLTGKDHWETLIRARAIETECWLAAAAQWGSYPTPAGERQSFGQSMIVDPWGAVVARVSDGLGFASASIDTDLVARVRQQIPVGANKAIHIEASL